MRVFLFIVAICHFSDAINALPPALTTKHIKIDQFGYIPANKKIAVIVDPQTGYNGAESFNPGTGVNQYQLRRWADDVVVYSGTLVAWNAGATHAQSGDKGWYFDFSSFTTQGAYYVFDVANNVGSYRFEISNAIYNDLIKQAARMYFYQRINFAKQIPFTDAKWADGAAFGGPNQDYAARSRYDKTNPATARDLHGGWMDAGDYNKYTTFALGPICNLLETYRMHKVYFADNYNIPESGNGIPDILDEVKWEMDWLTRMQDGTGTNGLFIKLGVDNFNAASPPSADNNPRYYVPECTSATLTGAAVFSLGSIVYKSLSNAAMITYGNDLLTRAINAWNRAKVTTSNFNTFQTACDDQDIKAGDADMSADDQKEMVVTAAAYLFEATGNNEYKNCFDTMYLKARPISFWWWGPYYGPVQRALLRYTTYPGATVAVVNNIKTIKAGQNGVLSINDYNNKTDLYLSHMPDDQFHWNSNEVKSNAGLDNLDFVTFNINPAQQATYKETAENYLHWFHGVNPMGKVMLSNMYAYGGDSCVNEFYHSWFADGSVWDNVFTSLYGPAPGYLIGGVNKDFTVAAISPPSGQPIQKSYKEWNTGWNGSFTENSWEITEAGIYTQAAYISLLVRVIANSPGALLPNHFLSVTANRVDEKVLVSWKTAATDTKEFTVQRSINGVDFTDVGVVTAISGKTDYTKTDDHPDANKPLLYYRVVETNQAGASFYSPIVTVKKADKAGWSIRPNPVSDILLLYGQISQTEPTFLEIYDMQGKLMLLKTINSTAGNTAISVSVNMLAKGNYILHISTAEGIQKINFTKL